jgi:hypothetical protein
MPEPLTPVEEREWREQMAEAEDGTCWTWHDENVEWMLRLLSTLDVARAERDRAVAECKAWRASYDEMQYGSITNALPEARRLRAENEREGR